MGGAVKGPLHKELWGVAWFSTARTEPSSWAGTEGRLLLKHMTDIPAFLVRAGMAPRGAMCSWAWPVLCPLSPGHQSTVSTQICNIWGSAESPQHFQRAPGAGRHGWQSSKPGLPPTRPVLSPQQPGRSNSNTHALIAYFVSSTEANNNSKYLCGTYHVPGTVLSALQTVTQ